MICLMVLSVPTFAKENSDNVIRVGSFEETYNVVNEKGERSGYGYEYLQDIAGYAGWTYKYITSDWKKAYFQHVRLYRKCHQEYQFLHFPTV